MTVYFGFNPDHRSEDKLLLLVGGGVLIHKFAIGVNAFQLASLYRLKRCIQIDAAGKPSDVSIWSGK